MDERFMRNLRIMNVNKDRERRKEVERTNRVECKSELVWQGERKEGIMERRRKPENYNAEKEKKVIKGIEIIKREIDLSLKEIELDQRKGDWSDEMKIEKRMIEDEKKNRGRGRDYSSNGERK